MKRPQPKRGFTAIEMIVVIGILGILLVASYPAILNTLETRSLENTTRDILTALQTARFRTIDTKVNHRVRFFQQEGSWRFAIEEESEPGVWTVARGTLTKAIPSNFVVTINLPDDQCIEYSSVGIVEDYDSTRNSVTLQSPKLRARNQPDLRILQVYGGGSVRNLKSSSG